MIYKLPGRAPNIHSDAYVAPNATVIGSVNLGAYASIWFGAILRGDNDEINIGARTNIQDAAVLHIDADAQLHIGTGVTIGHQAMLHSCSVGDGSLIGIGACILNLAKVGKQSIVGAHTLITEGKKFPPRSLIIGSPGRVVRELNQNEIALLEESAAHYVNKIKIYKQMQAVELASKR